MRVVRLPSAFYQIARLKPHKLSPKAQERLRWLSVWQRLRDRGISGHEAAELVGVPRATLYRWLRRLKSQGLKGLEDRSKRPKHTRRPTWS